MRIAYLEKVGESAIEGFIKKRGKKNEEVAENKNVVTIVNLGCDFWSTVVAGDGVCLGRQQWRASGYYDPRCYKGYPNNYSNSRLTDLRFPNVLVEDQATQT